MRAGVKVLVWTAGGLSSAFAGPAFAQETCADRLDRIEASLADADLPAEQRSDVEKILAGARDLAAAGEEDACQRTAGTLDQLRTSLAVTDDVEAGQLGPTAGRAGRSAPPAGAAADPSTPGGSSEQATSPTAGDRPAGTGGATGTGPAAALTVSEAEQLIGRRVVDRGGNPVGELVDVARLRGRDQAFGVVRHGGLLGVGERDAMVMLGELQHGEAGDVVLSRTAAGVLDELPEYDRVTFESVTGRLN
jgi:hypothetical protein